MNGRVTEDDAVLEPKLTDLTPDPAVTEAVAAEAYTLPAQAAQTVASLRQVEVLVLIRT